MIMDDPYIENIYIYIHIHTIMQPIPMPLFIPMPSLCVISPIFLHFHNLECPVQQNHALGRRHATSGAVAIRRRVVWGPNGMAMEWLRC